MYEEGVLGGFSFRGYTRLVSNRPLSVPKGIIYEDRTTGFVDGTTLRLAEGNIRSWLR